MSNTAFTVVPVTAYIDDSSRAQDYWEATEKLSSNGITAWPAVLIVCRGKKAEERRRKVMETLGGTLA